MAPERGRARDASDPHSRSRSPRAGTNAPRRGGWRAAAGLTLLSATGVLVGWPTLHAEHLSGDDDYLIFNYAPVNHPSWEHAWKLLTIIHRDLYQPIPLLTFQAEFALHRQADPRERLEALHTSMHWGNVLIHTLNGVLVWLLFRRLTRRDAVGLLVAMLFLTHPLAVECYAWLNGRMIMLSTTFSLAALLAFDAWQTRLRPAGGGGAAQGAAPHRAAAVPYHAGAASHGAGAAPEAENTLTDGAAGPGSAARGAKAWVLAAAILLLTALAMMSKVNAGLPILMLVLAAWRSGAGHWWPGGLLRRPAGWALFAGVAAITVVFAVINYHGTAESRLFEGAEHQLRGPNLARAVLAVGWYLRHYIWPAGLAPWYAPPATVSWTDSNVLQAIAVCALALGIVLVSLRWSRVGVLGALWFLAALGSTLPVLFPARNLLAADRYAYLPLIGLHWMAAAGLLALAEALLARVESRRVASGQQRLARSGGRRASQPRLAGWVARAALPAALIVPWVIVSRTVASYYHDKEAKIRRMVEVSPEYPTLLTAWAGYRFESGDYTGAIDLVERELARHADDPVAFVRAMETRAQARMELGDFSGAEADLRAAVEREPEYAKAYFRLGQLYRRMDQPARAIAELERACQLAPGLNPAVKLLGRLHRETGRLDAARQRYEQAVESSLGYDAEAINVLGEIDIEQRLLDQALTRYEKLLSWHPHDAAARINFGRALALAGQADAAESQFRAALHIHPGAFAARLNLALVLAGQGRVEEAWHESRRLIRDHPDELPGLVLAAKLDRARGDHAHAAALWERAAQAQPGSSDAAAWYAYHLWFMRRNDAAAGQAERALELEPGHSLARIVQVLIALRSDAPQGAAPLSEHLLDQGLSPDAFEYAYEALEYQTAVAPDSPWPYYVTAALLLAEGRHELAQATLGVFKQHCSDPEWAERLAHLVARHRNNP